MGTHEFCWKANFPALSEPERSNLRIWPERITVTVLSNQVFGDLLLKQREIAELEGVWRDGGFKALKDGQDLTFGPN